MKNQIPMGIKKRRRLTKPHKQNWITGLYDSKQDNPKQMHIIPNYTQNTKI